MEVKKGYKQTNMGILPADWKADFIGNMVSKVGSGITPTGGANVYVSEGRPFLRSQNVGWGTLLLDDIAYITDATHSTFPATEIAEGDVFLNITGASIGRSAKATIEVVGGNVNQHVCIIRPVGDILNQDYLLYVLLSRIGQLQIVSFQAGGNRQGLNFVQIKSIQIPLPPKPEQTAIATALSDTDALIRSLEKLIAKKRAIKHGAMQELSTGKKRLPGFEGNGGFQKTEVGKVPADWAVVRMGDVGQTFIGLTYSPSCVAEHGALVLRSSNVQNGKLSYEDNVFVQMDLPPRVMVKEGDILICVRNGSRQLIGKCALIDKSADGAAFGAFMSLYRSKHSPFIFRQFQSTIIQRQINETLGATINQITNKDMAWFLVCLPKKPDEENAIVEVLSSMDSELTVLERKLSKLRFIKQGMMQELLTGRIRLVEEKADAKTVQFPHKKNKRPEKYAGHNWEFNEAVVIAVLAKHFGSEKYPLGRKRYTKLSYLLHRHSDNKIDGYIRKAAGPYNPSTRYKGPESIALKNNYIRKHNTGNYSGFISSDKVERAEHYFNDWYGGEAIDWLQQFRLKSNDELELLTTVDLAMQDLSANGHEATVAGVKSILKNDKEWRAKLDRDTFSDANIQRAIKVIHSLFGAIK